MHSFLIHGASALHTGDAADAVRTPAQGTDVRVRVAPPRSSTKRAPSDSAAPNNTAAGSWPTPWPKR